MNYGLIGEKLGHSFSAEIHGALGDYGYELKEIPRDELDAFMKSAPFKGINVTIPYKETVMPYLAHIDEGAAAIGAVNTVVNRGGRLYGYNTDFVGMKALLCRIGIAPKGKKTLILGTGGTAKTATAVVKALGGTVVYKVSRSGADGALTYEEAYVSHSDASYIINTTPVGMYPKIDGCPVDLDRFSRLEGVADAVYNPLRTVLVQSAKERGIAAEGGLFMLVAQAVAASEYFLDTVYDAAVTDKIYKRLLKNKENIVLIGMPSSGKSTVAGLLAERLDKTPVDTDTVVEETAGKTIPDIFEAEGEAAFRDMESNAVKAVSRDGGRIIATGGGAVLRAENVRALKQNGRLYFLDRPLPLLLPTDGRPLSRDADALKKRYNERYGIYTACADCRVENSGTAEMAADMIIKEFFGE